MKREPIIINGGSNPSWNFRHEISISGETGIFIRMFYDGQDRSGIWFTRDQALEYAVVLTRIYMEMGEMGEDDGV